MCHSLDVEECSKPKFKSVGLHFTVTQIDTVSDGSTQSRNMVEGARGRVCNLKCRFILKQSGNWKMHIHHINFDAFSYDAVTISWWFNAHLRFPAKMSRRPLRSTRYEKFRYHFHELSNAFLVFFLRPIGVERDGGGGFKHPSSLQSMVKKYGVPVRRGLNDLYFWATRIYCLFFVFAVILADKVNIIYLTLAVMSIEFNFHFVNTMNYDVLTMLIGQLLPTLYFICISILATGS